jgi:hypothetical protein
MNLVLKYAFEKENLELMQTPLPLWIPLNLTLIPTTQEI